MRVVLAVVDPQNILGLWYIRYVEGSSEVEWYYNYPPDYAIALPYHRRHDLSKYGDLIHDLAVSGVPTTQILAIIRRQRGDDEALIFRKDIANFLYKEMLESIALKGLEIA